MILLVIICLLRCFVKWFVHSFLWFELVDPGWYGPIVTPYSNQYELGPLIQQDGREIAATQYPISYVPHTTHIVLC